MKYMKSIEDFIDENLNEFEREALEEKNEQLRLSALRYKGSVEQMKSYQDQLVNVTLSEQQLADIFEKTNDDIIKAEAKRIKEQLKSIRHEKQNHILNMQIARKELESFKIFYDLEKKILILT